MNDRTSLPGYVLGIINQYTTSIKQMLVTGNGYLQRLVAESKTALDTSTAAAASATSSAAAALSSQTQADLDAQSSASAATKVTALLLTFGKEWYGESATDPTTDPNGNAPTVGALYFNTTENKIREYTSDGWADYDAEAQTLAANASLSAAQALTSKNTAVQAQASATASQNAAATSNTQATAAATSASASLSATSAVVSKFVAPSAGNALDYVRINAAGTAYEAISPSGLISALGLATNTWSNNTFLLKSGDTAQWLNVNGSFIAGYARGMNGDTSTSGGYCWGDGVFTYGWGQTSVGLYVSDVVSTGGWRAGACLDVTNQGGTNAKFFFCAADNYIYDQTGTKFLKSGDVTYAETFTNNPVSDSGGTGNFGTSKFPNGLIFQWGYTHAADGSATGLLSMNAANNFPTEFPNEVFTIVAGNTNSQGQFDDNAYAYIVSNSQYFIGTKSSGNNGLTSYPVSWMALGR